MKTKYMQQELFDLYVLGILIEKVSTNKEYEDLNTLQSARDQAYIYKNDYIFVDQLLQVVNSIFTSWDNIEKDFLMSIYEKRCKLNDEMKPKSLFKKMFNGSIYAQSHKNPELRVDQSLENIIRLSRLCTELTTEKATILAFKLAKYHMNSFFGVEGVATNDNLIEQIDIYLKEEKLTATHEQKTWMLKKALYEVTRI